MGFGSEYEMLCNEAFRMTGNPYIAMELRAERERLNEAKNTKEIEREL